MTLVMAAVDAGAGDLPARVAAAVGAGADRVDLGDAGPAAIAAVRTAHPDVVVATVAADIIEARERVEAGAGVLRLPETPGAELLAVVAELGVDVWCPAGQAERAVAAGVRREALLVDAGDGPVADLVAAGWTVLVDLAGGSLWTETLAATALVVWDGAQVVRVDGDEVAVDRARQSVDMVDTIAGRRRPQRAIRGLQ